MKHVIVGTAGHVDHGKTMLVKALTGVDTDRLQEEKKRGITIELGFARLKFDDGTEAGVVDVPGHEKFIKNMLAGAGGIDLAMLVVAADEGFMPQTVEHLGILSLLGIRSGLVVITKADLVDEDWLELVREDVREKIRGSFLENSEILVVSAYTGQGIQELREHLRRMVQLVKEKNVRVPFRLPVDRVFSVDGFGTVVTGTLVSGSVKVGSMAQLMPSGLTAKVRNLQVHNRNVETAYAGQRVAINLAGLKKSGISRGDAVVEPGSVAVSRMLDVQLQNLKDSGRIIQSGSQVHFYHGSGVALAKCVLLDRDELRPGESGYAQLRLTEPVSAPKGDRFVIRFLSPVETIGGGIVLDDRPKRHRRNDPQVLETLRIRENGSDAQRLLQAVAEGGPGGSTRKNLLKKIDIGSDECEKELAELTGQGAVIEVKPGCYLASAVLDQLWEKGSRILEDYHAANRLQAGIKVAELRQRLLPSVDLSMADAILMRLVEEGKLKKVGDRYALAEFTIRMTKKQAALKEQILTRYRCAGLDAPTLEEVLLSAPLKDRDDCKQVVESLTSSGDLVMLSPQISCCREVYQNSFQKLIQWLNAHETITLAEYRDLMNTSRKYALLLLEYFDRNRVTKKEGDFRVRGDGFPVE